MAFCCHVDPDEKPEPIAAEANHERSDVPQGRQGSGRRCCGRRVREDHDGRAYDVDQKTVHRQKMGNSAPHVAEFARRHDINHGGLHRDRYHLSAADPLLRLFVGVPPVLKEVAGALLMRDVEKRATHDQEGHHDYVNLHDGG